MDGLNSKGFMEGVMALAYHPDWTVCSSATSLVGFLEQFLMSALLCLPGGRVIHSYGTKLPELV